MSFVTIIKGAPESGKTSLVNTILQRFDDGSVYHMNGSYKFGAFGLSGINSNTKVVVIDDLMDDSDHWGLLGFTSWRIEKQLKHSITIPAKDIIITTNLDIKLNDKRINSHHILSIFELKGSEHRDPLPF